MFQRPNLFQVTSGLTFQREMAIYKQIKNPKKNKETVLKLHQGSI